jgi:serine/threonine-protein kinase
MASGQLQPGQDLEGTYRIVGRIGGGAMGDVYEATHARLAGRYAIKVLQHEVAADPSLMARFEREARVTSSLRHPNIVQVLDFRALPDGTPYIVMEYLDGTDLARELATSGPLPLARVVALVDQIASGLSAAHELGVVHRDLKPANLFLVVLPGSGRELVKIVDFGISKVSASASHLTATATVMGTPQYMAPEQAEGRVAEIDARSDQFSLAAIAYEMIAGRCAFAGENIPSVLYQLVHADPAPLAVNGQPVGAAVEAVIRRALAKRPDGRYPTVLDFARALAAAVSGAAASESIASAGTAVAAAAPAVAQLPAATAQPPAAPARAGLSRAARRAVAASAGAAAIVLVLALRCSSGSSSHAPAPSAAQSAAPPAPAPAAAAAPPAPGPTSATAQVTIEVQDAPPGLVVAVDGAAPAPPPARVAKGSGAHQMVFWAPGYKSKTLQLDSSRDLAIVLSLAKAADGTRHAAAPAPPEKKKHGRFRHDVDAATGFVKRHFGTGGD